MTNTSHLVHFLFSFLSEEEKVSAVNCFQETLLLPVCAVVSGRGSKVNDMLLMQTRKKSRFSVMVSVEGFSRVLAWVAFNFGRKTSQDLWGMEPSGPFKAFSYILAQGWSNLDDFKPDRHLCGKPAQGG